MDPGTFVVARCGGPKEKFWGVLLGITASGATIRGIPLPAFEDYLLQEAKADQHLLGASTVFFPLHRVERLELDESSAAVEGLADRFRRVTGRDPKAELLGLATRYS
jgi:hypothetical protein